jgi:DNA-binding XRE family transcriptional regulator
MTLEEYRGLLSWSQAELARQAGLNNQTVSYAERVK